MTQTTQTKKTTNIVYIALFTALIAICSQLSIPFGPVPFTLQTLAVFLTAGLLGPKRGTLCVIVYILLGLVGVPVFAGFSGGLPSVVSPAFGYIIGFLFTALVVGFGCKHFSTKWIPMIVSMVLGLILCYIFGTAWFLLVYKMNGNGIGLMTALSYCVFPFLIPDACKILVSAILLRRLKPILPL